MSRPRWSRALTGWLGKGNGKKGESNLVRAWIDGCGPPLAPSLLTQPTTRLGGRPGRHGEFRQVVARRPPPEKGTKWLRAMAHRAAGVELRPSPERANLSDCSTHQGDRTHAGPSASLQKRKPPPLTDLADHAPPSRSVRLAQSLSCLLGLGCTTFLPPAKDVNEAKRLRLCGDVEENPGPEGPTGPKGIRTRNPAHATGPRSREPHPNPPNVTSSMHRPTSHPHGTGCPPNAVPLVLLPITVQQDILQFLAGGDLYAISCTCNSWRRLTARMGMRT